MTRQNRSSAKIQSAPSLCSMGLLPAAEPLISSLLSALEANFSGILVTSGSASLEAELRSRRARDQESVPPDTDQNGSRRGTGMRARF